MSETERGEAAKRIQAIKTAIDQVNWDGVVHASHFDAVADLARGLKSGDWVLATFDWRAWCCFMFTDNSRETQALPDDELRRLIARNRES